MAEPTTQLEPQVVQKLRHWQKDLLDLSKANRSLYHRTTRTSTIPILEPSYADLYEGLWHLDSVSGHWDVAWRAVDGVDPPP